VFIRGQKGSVDFAPAILLPRPSSPAASGRFSSDALFVSSRFQSFWAFKEFNPQLEWNPTE
jgi:hypothetical protein